MKTRDTDEDATPAQAPTPEHLREIAEAVVVMATEKKQTIATAESCTGGLVAHLITETPGSSHVLEAGWVCYSNTAKIRLLDVPKETIMEHGAVSQEVAKALAAGARSHAHADHAVATTGIAGPTGATPGKAVGLMWCSVANAHGTQSSATNAPGLDRSATKRAFALYALKRLQESIESA